MYLHRCLGDRIRTSFAQQRHFLYRRIFFFLTLFSFFWNSKQRVKCVPSPPQVACKGFGAVRDHTRDHAGGRGTLSHPTDTGLGGGGGGDGGGDVAYGGVTHAQEGNHGVVPAQGDVDRAAVGGSVLVHTGGVADILVH